MDMSSRSISRFSSRFYRTLVAIVAVISIGLLIEIVYLIKFKHGFVLEGVMVEKIYSRMFEGKQRIEMIEFKKKTVYITQEENEKYEIMSRKRSFGADQLFITKLVELQNRTSNLTTTSQFDRTYLLQSLLTGNVYLIRADQDILKEIENEILWIQTFDIDLKTNLNMFQVYEAGKNSTNDRRISLEILLIPSLRESSSMEKISEIFKNNFISFMKYHTENYNIELVGDGMVDIQVPIKVLDRVANYLLENPSVKWIQRKEPLKISNKVATKLAQGLRTDNELISNVNPIWDKNITGEGEIITVADTGLDWDNCFFSDPSTTVTTGQSNNNHRKVLAYINQSNGIKTADGKDSIYGHGTHVCGSAAGHFNQISTGNNSLAKHNGIAFKSKLIMLDIENENESGLLIPSDIRKLFLQGYTLNSKIFSNSYTCSYASLLVCYFDCRCYLLEDDQLLGKKFSQVSNEKCRSAYGLDCCKLCNNYGKRDMLVDDFLYQNQDSVVIFAAGNEGSSASDGTIAITSKNAIVVGASMSSNQGFIDSIPYINLVEEAEICGVSVETCCSDHSCSFSCCPTKMEAVMKLLKSSHNQNNMAAFSARGPATGNRMKPDCVADGDRIVSARSDGSLTTNQCANIQPNSTNDAALRTSSGTSMSTPIVAGSVALIREYLRKIKGQANPSGPLLKAALITSCTSLSGVVSLDNSGSAIVPLSKIETPNIYEGFGAVGLSNVLEFNDSTFNLEVYDRQELASASSSEILCFTTTSKDTNSFMKATLAWYDAPSQANTIPSLRADFDLEVAVFDDGIMSQRVYGNFGKEKDSHNNVEKVSLNELNSKTNGEIFVMAKVTAAIFPKGQKYSLVLTRSKNMKKVDPTICQNLYKASGDLSFMEITLLIVIGFVALCLSSVLCLTFCISVCVLRKSTGSCKINPNV